MQVGGMKTQLLLECSDVQAAILRTQIELIVGYFIGP